MGHKDHIVMGRENEFKNIERRRLELMHRSHNHSKESSLYKAMQAYKNTGMALRKPNFRFAYH